MNSAPFNLAVRGYTVDPTNANRFINKDGHPFYPVILDPEIRHSDGYIVRAIALAAYQAGSSFHSSSYTSSTAKDTDSLTLGLPKP